MDYLAVALAGSLGAVVRFAVVRALEPASATFPWPVFAVNVAGCLLFGLAWSWGAARWPELVKVAVLAGFLGGFTTFSSFAFDSVALLERGRVLAAAANVLGQNVLGIAALFAGIAVGRAL
jgi:fluoride exporter